MSTFQRRGHWRTGKNGTRHWVSGHSVARESTGAPWTATSSRAGTRSTWPPRTIPTSGRRHYVETFAKPNARCPVCGASVYFYSNEHGSRVFFDELGPPWPKHPCTANEPDAQRTEARRSFPVALPQSEVQNLHVSSHSVVGDYDASSYLNKYKIWPLSSWVISKATQSARLGVSAYRVWSTSSSEDKLVMTTSVSVLPEGSAVFLSTNFIHHLDLHSLTPKSTRFVTIVGDNWTMALDQLNFHSQF